MHNSLTKLSLILLAAVCIGGPSVAKAGNSRVEGKWAGTAYANGAIDLNADGVFARTFVLNAFDQGQFTSIEGVVDTELVALGCSGPASIELQPLGKISFRGRGNDVLFAEVDPAAPNLCFDATNPSEILVIRIIGGRGRYSGATGTGTLNIHDVDILSRPVTLPGFPTLPAPLVVDSQGEFSLSIK